MDHFHARGARGAGKAAGTAGRETPLRQSLRYEALRFPGCRRVSLSRAEFEDFDDRIEYWDARTETAWVLADKYGVHEGTSRRLPHLAERIASVRGTPIVSYGSVTLLVRDEAGEPRRAMEADETLYLHPSRSATPRKSLVIGENDFPDVVLEVDYTTDVRPGKLLLYEAWGFPELWVIVPPEGGSPRRPAGVKIHRLQDGRYRSMPASGAFPGWTAGEIYDGMTEPTPSAATYRVMERIGRTLGAREGTGPADDPLSSALVAEGRLEGRARELAAAAQSLLRVRDVAVSSTFPERAAALTDVSRDAVMAAAYACADEADFWDLLSVDSRDRMNS
ncbi:MAG: Uma2 family endonuclease [Acidobacteria bacterium]|nr:Uma2 family endonuclease [Acidobacteriota bacterium]